VNCPAATGAMQMKLPNPPDEVPVELPPITTYVPAAPPVQLNVAPDPRVMVASAAVLLQTSSGLGKVTEVVKAPMLAAPVPPVPVKVNVPPEEGMNPLANCPS